MHVIAECLNEISTSFAKFSIIMRAITLLFILIWIVLWKLASSLLLALFGILTNSAFAQGSATASADATAASAPQTTTPAPLHLTKLGITDTVIGTGDEVVNGTIVEVHYTGWLYNHKAWNLRGAQFDTSRDSGTPLQVMVGAKQVIRGWDMWFVGNEGRWQTYFDDSSLSGI